MSKEIALGMLRAGKTGNDILAILDTMIGEEVIEETAPTLEEIDF